MCLGDTNWGASLVSEVAGTSVVALSPRLAQERGHHDTFRVSARRLFLEILHTLTKAALFASTVFLLAPGVRANTAFIRVNQLGYEAGTLSRAYLMSKTSEAGAVFRVLDSSGHAKFSAPIGSDLGKWGKFTVYALDFRVSESGSYAIEVNGTVSPTSLRFRVHEPEDLYSPPFGTL
jgi:hypothetical protein